MVQEKIVVTAGRDGGLQNMEVLGTLQLKVSDAQYGRILIAIDNQDDRSLQFQVYKSLNDNMVIMEMCEYRLIQMLIRSYSLRIV